MHKESTLSTLSRIRHHYRNLPPGELKIANLLLDFPGEIASYSATELAELAGVSKAAITRFFKRLGYESFEQARRATRKEQAWGSPLYLLTQDQTGKNHQSSLHREMEVELRNLAKTYEKLDVHYLESIARKMMSADRIWLFGIRHSKFLADYARFQLLQIRADVFSLTSENATLAEQLVDLKQTDIVFAIGFRRRTRRFLQAMKEMQEKGVRILYLTEPDVGTSINYATWVLSAEVSGTGAFDSYPAACSIIHLLSSSMMSQSGEKIGERLKQIENEHANLEDF